ncbi:MAG: FHA domain-containing protein [Bdellovibrionaceae bacterium]|nr:FHA domain-containing protein [Bdellovibrionales bacterium]MCB9086391.1 FHA domain-containing protein [Pseudobdellovibrionaceae bacterium]
MWVIRVLSGPQAGQTYKLSEGTNVIGREPGCDIILASGGVSKQHCKIDVFDGKLIITDLGSRNGTFVNGVKVQSIRLQGAEKIALHDVIVDINKATVAAPAFGGGAGYQQGIPGGGPHYQGNVAYQYNPGYAQQPGPQAGPQAVHHGAPGASAQAQGKPTLFKLAQKYIDDVALPGVYKLPEIMEFKWVLALFMGAFIFFVTSLSAVPLMRILKASIEKESQRRALTIARTLAKVNRAPLSQGMESAINVDIASREPGVEQALIIDSVDGNIKAPASRAGQVPDLPFIHEARREGKEVVTQIDDGTIGALVPIEFYNPETGSQAVTAYAAVIYNMGSLAVDDSRTLSLFIQTFFIALIVGSILFFFLYKAIEFPIRSLNVQLDRALKENRDDLKTSYLFPPLQKLVSNINSALSRMGGDDMGGGRAMEYDRSSELSNLVQLVGFGCMGITAHDNTIQAVNPEFESRTGMHSQDLVFQTVDKINDQALRLNIADLIERCTQTPYQIATNSLEISGETYEIAAQAVHGSENVSYFLITLLPGPSGGEIV